jgi:serine protease Do
VNLKGQVIGVNNAIVAGAQGIGFAIPIDEVKNIIPQLEKNGRIKKGYLGVGLADIDPNAAASLGLKDAEGVIVAQVDKNGPAYKAGIRPYDVIKEYNGKKITNSAELQNAVADTTVGKTVKVEVIREAKSKNFDVTMSERPEANSPAMLKGKKEASVGQKAPFNAGFNVADINESMIKEYNIDSELKGKPIVTEIQNKTGAAQSGLRPGDVILDVNRIEVNNSAEVLKNLKKGTNTLRIARGAQIRILLLNVE